MNIYIVRHGETPWNKKKLIQGQRDVPLNEYGRELAQKTGEGMKEIPFDKVFSSPLIRAKETAELLMKGRNLPIETDNRLMEICFGGAEGMRLSELYEDKENPMSRFLTAPAEYEPPKGGETFLDVRKRGMDFLSNQIVPLEGQYENILLVAHACIIRSMISGIQKLSIEEFWEGPPYKNCCVCRVECRNGILTLKEEAVLYYEEG